MNDEKSSYCFRKKNMEIFLIFNENKIHWFWRHKNFTSEAGMQPYRFSNFDKKDLRFQTYKNFIKNTQNFFFMNYLVQIM